MNIRHAKTLKLCPVTQAVGERTCGAGAPALRAAVLATLAPFTFAFVGVAHAASAPFVLQSTERVQRPIVLEEVGMLTAARGAAGTRVAARDDVLEAPMSSVPPDQLIVAGPMLTPGSAQAFGDNSIAAGIYTVADGQNAVAVGTSVDVKGDSAVSVGSGNVVSAAMAVALGTRNELASERGVIVGAGSTVGPDAPDAVSIGSFNQIGGARGTAIGRGNVVLGAGSVAIGDENSATGAGSFVLGSKIRARGANSVVLGANSDGSQDNVVSVGAIGSERRVVNVGAGRTGTDAINLNQLRALGASVDASGNPLNPFVAYDAATRERISLGGTAGTTITNVKAGALSATSTDAVNGAQLHATDSKVGDVASTVAGLSAAGARTVSYDDTSRERLTLSGAGGTTVSNVKAGMADLDAVNVAQLKQTGLVDGAGRALAALTYDTRPDGTINRQRVTLGGANASVPVALRNVAAGRVEAGSTDAVNGDQLFSTAQLIANVQNGASKYFVTNSSLGQARAIGVNSTAAGANAFASAENTVALGANTVADRANSVSVGSAGHERQITNVAAGTADTDAVNVAQLKTAGIVDAKGNTATALVYDRNPGGSTDYNNVTLGLPRGGGTLLHNVGTGVAVTDAVNVGQLTDALSRVQNAALNGSAFFSADGDASAPAAVSSGARSAAVGAGAVASAGGALSLGAGASASADRAVALGTDSVANRASTVSVGSAGNERQIVNVAAGSADTEATNVAQLRSASASTLGQAKSYTDQRFNSVDQQLRDLDHDTRKGIASASALNVVTPYLPGRTTLNAGVAAYRGQAALGIGVSRWNDKGTVNFNAGVASSGSNSTIVRAGVGFVLGG